MRSQPMEDTMLSQPSNSLVISVSSSSRPGRVARKAHTSPPAAATTVGGTRDRMVVEPAG